MIETGQPLPTFQLKNQQGQTRTLADYKGHWLVLYIYPQDDTPGCTIQARSFTATKAEFDQAGITVVGLSADDQQSHQRFCDKFSLTIELLSDPQATLLRALDPGQKEWNGTMYWNRTTFVADPQGVVRKIYTGVKPDGHERMLLDDIKQLQLAAQH
ncbi:MAG TPA: peroxiredoxin [Candidatus Xenobia bacterium]|jgi:peroxiredoxin Q/BCP